jgi:hypothetical protein
LEKTLTANITKHANLQLSYWVDSSNIIRKVDDHWDQDLEFSGHAVIAKNLNAGIFLVPGTWHE